MARRRRHFPGARRLTKKDTTDKAVCLMTSVKIFDVQERGTLVGKEISELLRREQQRLLILSAAHRLSRQTCSRPQSYARASASAAMLGTIRSGWCGVSP